MSRFIAKVNVKCPWIEPHESDFKETFHERCNFVLVLVLVLDTFHFFQYVILQILNAILSDSHSYSYSYSHSVPKTASAPQNSFFARFLHLSDNFGVRRGITRNMKKRTKRAKGFSNIAFACLLSVSTLGAYAQTNNIPNR